MVYIIKTDSAVICYYYSEGRLLKRVRSERGLSAELVLMSGIRPSFSLSLTEKGESCIFCRDLRGNVIFVREGGEKTERRVLLESVGKGFGGNLLFDAVIRENEIDLLYNTAPKNGTHSLYIQKLAASTEPPRYIDGACPVNSAVFRTVRISPRLRIVFYLKRRSDNRLGYREILDCEEGRYNTVFVSGAPFGDYSLAADSRGLHFAAVTSTFFSSRLLYRGRGAEGFTETRVAVEMGNITSPLVFLYNNKPALFFKSGEKPYIAYNPTAPRPFKGKICSELSRGSFIDKTKTGAVKGSEVLVDSNKPWDIQLYPEIDENFYAFRASAERAEKPSAEYTFKDLFSKKGSVTL